MVLSMAWKTVAVALMAAGLLLVTVRLTLPGISHYRPDIERWLSDVLAVPVSIGDLHAEWNGWTPELRIDNVRLVQRQGGETVAQFARASFTIDPVASLKRGEIRPGDITLTGASFVITRQRDGAITFTSKDQDGIAGSMSTDAMLPWLLRHQRLKLRDTDVVWRDLRDSSPPLVFHDVELNARNDGQRHQFEGTVRLPEDYGARLTIALDAVGNIMTPAWSGEIFLRGESIRSPMWGFLEKSLGLTMRGGSSDFEVWSTWENARLQRAEGTVNILGTDLPGRNDVLHVARAAASVSVWRSGYGWDVDVAGLELTTAHGSWPTTGLSLSYLPATPDQAARLTGEIGFVRLRDLLPLLGEHLPLDAELVSSGQLNAELRELAFAFTPVEGELHDLQLGMQVDNLDVAPLGDLPGLSGLRGRLEVAGGRGQLQLAGGGLVLDAPNSLPGSLTIDSAVGRLTWASAASGWQLDTDGLVLANEDLALRLRGSLRFRESDPSPFMRLVLQLQRGRLAALKNYLPRDLLSAAVTDWLLHSLPAGEVVGGQMLLHGLLSDFPFDAARGRLQARFDVEGATLDYQAGWPMLTDVRGHMTFDGARMQLVIDSGTVSGARILRAEAAIDDMAAEIPVLRVGGQIGGTTEQTVAYLNTSPLRDEFATALDAVAVKGPSELDLEMQIPLSDEPMRVRGAMRLSGNSVHIDGLERGLDNLSGRVDFTNYSVTSHSLEARYLGHPVQIDLARGVDAKLTRISLRGRTDRELLLAHFRNMGVPLEGGDSAGLLLDHAAGESDFIANLDVPDDWRAQGTVARFEAQSTLQGVSLDLPAPIGKVADEQRLLRVRAAVHSEARRVISFAYGDIVAGSIELSKQESGLSPGRGVLLFGAAGAELPGEKQMPAPGRVRIAGDIDALSISDWYTAVQNFSAQISGSAPPFAVLDQIAEIDLHVGELRVLDYELSDVGMSGERLEDETWSLLFSGPDIAGKALVPPPASDLPINIDLDHLAVQPRATATIDDESEGYDPRGLPGVEFVSRSLRHGDLELGHVQLSTRTLPDGVEITRVAVDNAAFRAEGSGRWQHDGVIARSLFKIEIAAQRLDELMAAFGYLNGNIEDGATEVRIAADWDGAPSEFSLRGMRGTLGISSGPGRLLEVNAGAAGRVFGLLSLASLPRRLRLDFGDLFDEGFTFDRIEGSFSLDGGNAYTNDLTIDGTSARVDLAGRTGLVNQDYDQLLTVTPRLASTLPLAGAVLGPLGVGVGAVIWLAEKMFDQPLIDQMAAIRYTITGTWDEPLVEAITPPPREEELFDDRG